MARRNPTTVRSAALRRHALDVLKTISMGFKSGEYCGRKYHWRRHPIVAQGSYEGDRFPGLMWDAPNDFDATPTGLLGPPRPHWIRKGHPHLDPRQYRRAAEQPDELPASHSITSSARARRVGGISRPSTLAVRRFRMNSNLKACSTGRSAGLAPLRILST